MSSTWGMRGLKCRRIPSSVKRVAVSIPMVIEPFEIPESSPLEYVDVINAVDTLKFCGWRTVYFEFFLDLLSSTVISTEFTIQKKIWELKASILLIPFCPWRQSFNHFLLVVENEFWWQGAWGLRVAINNRLSICPIGGCCIVCHGFTICLRCPVFACTFSIVQIDIADGNIFMCWQLCY